MNLILIGIAAVVGFVVGFVAGVLQVKEIREVDKIAHNKLIERKNAEIWRLQNSNNELRQRNNAQCDAFDRITGFDGDCFKPF